MELFAAEEIRQGGETITEFRQSISKADSGGIGATDLDIVINGGAKVYQVKYSVKAFAPTSDFAVGTTNWVKDAMKAQKHWIAKVNGYNPAATIEYIYHNGPEIPQKLADFLLDLEVESIRQVGNIGGGG